MATLVQSSSGSLVAKTSLAVAVAAADSANKTIVVTGAESIATNLSVPATRYIVNEKGGTITVASGQTLTVAGCLVNNGTITGDGNLVISGAYSGTGTIDVDGTITINGPFSAGLYRVFAGTGTVTFGAGSHAGVFPQWWYSGTGTWATAFQAALDSGAHTILVPEGTYDFSTTGITQSDTGANTDGVAIVGLGTYHNTKITYSGTDYAISYEGTGADAVSSVSRIYLENIWISGGDSVNPLGALNLSRTFIVDLNRCQFSDFASVSANILNIRNTFNTILRNSQISGNGTAASAATGLLVGSEDASAWNTSNVSIVNSLIQRCDYGIKLDQDSNILDNLKIDSTSFSTNTTAHIYADSAYLYETVITNCHFELSAAGTGVDIRNATNVNISDNFFQNMLKHISLEDVVNFSIYRNKLQNPVAIAADTGISLSVNDGSCVGKMGLNSVNTTEITTPYSVGAGVRVVSEPVTTDETAWGSIYFPSPSAFGISNIVNRYAIDSGMTLNYYDRYYTSPNGTTWLRFMLSNKRVQWSSTMPTDGTYTIGDLVFNDNPTVAGSGGSHYTILGWRRITTGSAHVLNTDWVEMRMATGT